jgi:hypothetical protein
MEGPQAMRGMTPVLSHLRPALLTVLESSWRVAAPVDARFLASRWAATGLRPFARHFPHRISQATARASAGKTDHNSITKKTAPRLAFFLNDFFTIGEIFSGNFSTVPLMFR